MYSNKISIIDWYGGDKAIARAAWTSTQADVDAKSDEQIRDLIVNKLWNNGSGKPHKTPFERGIVEFNVTVEQASHIHLLKHRLANINGESARYKELKEDRYYIPEDWPDEYYSIEDYNSIAMCGIGHTTSLKHALQVHTEQGNKLYHAALKIIDKHLSRKRAKESARFFKTMNSQLTLSVMMNMSCFNNFYNLRADTAAQEEIQWVAEEMLRVIENIEGNPFKYTLEAFKSSKK